MATSFFTFWGDVGNALLVRGNHLSRHGSFVEKKWKKASRVVHLCIFQMLWMERYRRSLKTLNSQIKQLNLLLHAFSFLFFDE